MILDSLLQECVTAVGFMEVPLMISTSPSVAEAEVCPTCWVGFSQLQSVVQRAHFLVTFKLAMRGGLGQPQVYRY